MIFPRKDKNKNRKISEEKKMRVLKVNKENTKNILSDLLKRSPNNYDQYAGTVQGILDEIKEKGDEALFAYTEKFDKCKLTKDTIQVTEEEIKAIVKEGFDGGEVQEVEQDIVERVFNLGDRNVGSIMTHRSELVWLDVTDSTEKIREKVEENLFNIYPVASEKFDNIVGVVYLKDLFGRIDQPDFSINQVLRPAQFVPENQSVYNALESFKQTHVKYGLVTDEFGGIQGIVTLKDIMEGLIGQVPEVGEESEIIQREDGTWLVDGQYSFYDFLEYFDMEDLYAEHDYNTLSGLILEILERVPKTGEKLKWLDFEFEIVDMDGARIDKVLVKYLKNG